MSTELRGRMGRRDSDEDYVIELVDEVLGAKALRRGCHFDFLRGDTGRKLHVDAYYPDLRLVVEYNERQHTEGVKHFDKPGKLTASGIERPAQRARYDQYRRDLLPKHGIKLVEIDYSVLAYRDNRSKRLRRDRTNDLVTIRKLLTAAGVRLRNSLTLQAEPDR